MENFISFQIVHSNPVTISENTPEITRELSETTVGMITVKGNPWVVFHTSCYGGDFAILMPGTCTFCTKIKFGNIRSMRVINGGIDSSQVTFFFLPFYKGSSKQYDSNQSQLDEKFYSLKVDNGVVIFYDEEEFKGEKRIMLKGDTVENFTAVKLTDIGKSMKTAKELK